MGTGGIIIVLLCFGGPLLPPLVGTIVGMVHDAVTMRRLREQRAVARHAPSAVPPAVGAGAAPQPFEH